MRRIRNEFNIPSGVDFDEAHFFNSARAFAEHPSRRTTTIRRTVDNGQSRYYPFDVRMAYINEDPGLAVHIDAESTQSLHSHDSGSLEIQDSNWSPSMEEEDELPFHEHPSGQDPPDEPHLHELDIHGVECGNPKKNLILVKFWK